MQQVERGMKHRILVVDDNLDAAESLSMLLSLMGHDVRAAYDGLDAVAQAEAFAPNFVLLDIGLPRLNGYDVARTIRSRPWGKHVKLIATTGWGQVEDKQRAHEAGFNVHLTKPVAAEALRELLALD